MQENPKSKVNNVKLSCIGPNIVLEVNKQQLTFNKVNNHLATKDFVDKLKDFDDFKINIDITQDHVPKELEVMFDNLKQLLKAIDEEFNKKEDNLPTQ